MKRWFISSILIFSIASFSMVLAEDDKLSGEVSATGKLTSVVGNKAKFNEYRDVRDGVYGDVNLKYDYNVEEKRLDGVEFEPSHTIWI